MKTAIINSIEQAYVLEQEIKSILNTGNDAVIKLSKCTKYLYLSAGNANKAFRATSVLKGDAAKALLGAIREHLSNGKATVSQGHQAKYYDVRG